VPGDRKDLYAVLGVARDADADTLRKTYRKLAREHHPDVNPDDDAAEQRFKEISEAYAVLSDEEKRRLYDEFGEVSLESGFDGESARRAREAFGQRFAGGAQGRGGFRGFGGFQPDGGEEFAYGDLDDMLGDLFSRRGWQGGPRRGGDLEADIELDFLDAARGTEQRLSLGRPRADGSTVSESVTVRIPAGVADGGRIRLRGKGAEGVGGGPAGDLYARIRVRPHPFFRRERRDLIFDLPITIREATLGAKVEVPTLDGRVTLTIPPGSDSGRKLRLRGKGIPDPGGGPAGDLYAVLQIRVPENLDPETTEKVQELEALDVPDLRKELG
jgi:DnaJ-class molecular chaperone